MWHGKHDCWGHAFGMLASRVSTQVCQLPPTRCKLFTFDLELCIPSSRTNRKPQLFQVNFTVLSLCVVKNLRAEKCKNAVSTLDPSIQLSFQSVALLPFRQFCNSLYSNFCGDLCEGQCWTVLLLIAVRPR